MYFTLRCSAFSVEMPHSYMTYNVQHFQ